jgi:hypothetical protein
MNVDNDVFSKMISSKDEAITNYNKRSLNIIPTIHNLNLKKA